jgi:hypothetical protein
MGFSGVEEFSATALHFKEFGVYTKEPIRSKAWYAFWQQERDRCLNGYHIGRDEITGYHYNLLNYAPILQTEVIKEADNELGQNQAIRVKDFPKFMDGQYDFFHYIEDAEKAGAHAELIGSRGRGKSLMTASMGVRNYHHIPNSKSYYVASRENYLLGDGILPKVYDIMDFVDNHTPWSKRRHEANTMMHRKASVKIKNAAGVETIDPRSWSSEVLGLLVGDNVNKTRGIRGKLIIYEEIGSFKNSHLAWNINRDSMEDGKNTFGLMCAVGTGGDPGGMEGAEELFYNPRAYNIFPVTNKWDIGLEGTECAFFYPATRNYAGAMDKNGNSDEDKALKLLNEKFRLAGQGNDPHALTRRKAENPLCPRDAFMRVTGTQFPINDLRQQEAELEGKPHLYRDTEFVGRFKINTDTQRPEFVSDGTLIPIRKFPHKDNKNMPGAVVIWQHPKMIDGEVMRGRYLLAIDSYDFDESTTTSLGSCFVMDSWTGKIVAEYTGRPPRAEDFYETCRRLCLYYNGITLIENNNKGIFTYWDNKGCGYLIADEPDIVKEVIEAAKTSNNTRRRGYPPIDKLNAYARGMIANWLMQSTNNPDKPEECIIHTIRSIPAIQEMVLWNDHGNFDRVSALQVLITLYKDREKYHQERETKAYDIRNDDFWNKLYKGSKPRGFRL